MSEEGTPVYATTNPEPTLSGTPAHVRLTSEVSINDLTDSYWVGLSMHEGLTVREIRAWNIEADSLEYPQLPDLLAGVGAQVVGSTFYPREGRGELLIRLDETLTTVQFSPPSGMWVGVAAATHTVASKAMARFVRMFPEKKMSADEPEVAFSVWSHEARGPMYSSCEIEPWSSLEANYAPATRASLAPLMDPDFEPGKGGRLILLHGAPGTGKSTALTTLAWQWRSFAELHVIADPAAFLNDPAYLFNVTLGRRGKDRWRLVLIEDVGGLFAPDAKQNAGEDRLGRLLNATSGLLGNASKALWVLTSNEPLTNFHEAVSRPGRMAAAVEFLPFAETEAKEWLERQKRPDLAATVRGERSLAELYAMLAGTQVDARSKNPVGFMAGAA